MYYKTCVELHSIAFEAILKYCMYKDSDLSSLGSRGFTTPASHLLQFRTHWMLMMDHKQVQFYLQTT